MPQREEFVGGTRQRMSELQTDYAKAMEKYGLMRGICREMRLVSPKNDGILYSFTYYRPMFFDADAGFVCEYTIYNDNTYSDVVMDAYDDSEMY